MSTCRMPHRGCGVERRAVHEAICRGVRVWYRVEYVRGVGRSAEHAL